MVLHSVACCSLSVHFIDAVNLAPQTLLGMKISILCKFVNRVFSEVYYLCCTLQLSEVHVVAQSIYHYSFTSGYTGSILELSRKQLRYQDVSVQSCESTSEYM